MGPRGLSVVVPARHLKYKYKYTILFPAAAMEQVNIPQGIQDAEWGEQLDWFD